ncbi:MAG: sigma-70 family RNA polymerase sigma factor, partial [Vicinamibacteria bacterium]
MTPQELFESELPMVRDVVSFICRRRRLVREEAEDFRSFAFLKLMDNDFAILRKYEGRASLRTYLTIVIERLSIDYQISRWGKWRPSARAVELGPEAVELDSLLHRDGYTPHEAVQMLITRKKTTLGEDTLMGIASRLPSRPRRSRDQQGIPVGIAAQGDGADRTVLEKEREEEMKRVRQALERAFEKLTDEDRMIARLRFMSGWSPNQIASALRLDVKELYRRIEHLKKRLRKLL